MTALVVTDHCVVRYLERVKGVDVAAIRMHIEQVCRPAFEAGANGVQSDGVRFVIKGQHIVSAVPLHSPNPHARTHVPGTRFEALGDVAVRVLENLED